MQHGRVDAASLAVPCLIRSGHRGRGRDEAELGLGLPERSELVGERRILRPVVRMEEHHAIRQGSVAKGLDQDAAKRRGADAARQEGGRSRGIVQSERHRSFGDRLSAHEWRLEDWPRHRFGHFDLMLKSGYPIVVSRSGPSLAA